MFYPQIQQSRIRVKNSQCLLSERELESEIQNRERSKARILSQGQSQVIRIRLTVSRRIRRQKSGQKASQRLVTRNLNQDQNWAEEFQQGLMDSSPCKVTSADLGKNGWKHDVSFLYREKRWLITVTDLEG